MKPDTYSSRVKEAILSGNKEEVIKAFKEWRINRTLKKEQPLEPEDTYNHDEALEDQFNQFKKPNQTQLNIPINNLEEIPGNPEPLPF